MAKKNNSKQYAERSKNLGQNVRKKRTMELEKRRWKKSSKEVGNSECKPVARKQEKSMLKKQSGTCQECMQKVGRNWQNVVQESSG